VLNDRVVDAAGAGDEVEGAGFELALDDRDGAPTIPRPGSRSQLVVVLRVAAARVNVQVIRRGVRQGIQHPSLKSSADCGLARGRSGRLVVRDR